jgi:hypothetical protein
MKARKVLPRSDVFLDWAKEHRVQLLFVQPCKPAHKAFVERFHRSFGKALLDADCEGPMK